MALQGFSIAWRRVLVLEDVVTTGGSVREVIELVRKHGGQVVGVAAWSIAMAKLILAFHQALISLDVASYDPDDCPCAGRNSVKPGSRVILLSAPHLLTIIADHMKQEREENLARSRTVFIV